MTTTELADDLVRTRDQILDELRRADTKATTLLSLVGAAMAGVIALANRDVTGPGVVLLWSSLAPIYVSVMLLLSVIRPRLNREPAMGSWLYAARVGPSTLVDTHRHPVEGRATSVASEVCTLARIARSKYRRITAAVILLVAGVTMMVLSLVVMVVTS